MLTFQEVSEALEAVLGYNWEDELADFMRQLDENDGQVEGHVFLHLMTLHNFGRVLSGQRPHQLHELVSELAGNGEVYLCQDCGRISRKLEPVPERVFSCFTPGDVVPAGCCLTCGALCHPI